MAEISVSGYCNKPEAVVSKGGKSYSKFTLSSKQKNGKNADGTEKPATRVFYNCMDFVNSSPPEDGSYVTAKGWLKVVEYVTKDGRVGKNLEINVQELTVSPGLDGGSSKLSSSKAKTGTSSGASPETSSKDPWDE